MLYLFYADLKNTSMQGLTRDFLTSKKQGWGAGAGCFWLLGAEAAWKKPGAGAAWKKSREPEPLKN